MTMAQIKTELQTPAHDPAFKYLGSQRIESLNIVVEQYEHSKTGAVHYHLNSENDENVFLVGLRTVPMDSSGVAHILEHTALCGSESYPVRDPFFMMIRRSLNTFMNAFTSSDWTAYPFASKNKKDFNNLLDVYLDAVFFSRLHELDFKQEGHRVEFDTPNDPSTDLVFKGVVFNEMKGAMSSPVSLLWQTLTKYVFPTSTYHYNSGGEPTDIPDLTYDELKAFYSKHYHPSNAVFMTYGDIPAIEHQQKIEQRALSRFDRLDEVIRVDDEKRYFAPITIEESYAMDEEAEPGTSDQGKTHIVMGWLLDKSTDLETMLRAHLLSGVLLDNSSSPLRHALETTELGSAPSPLCGLEDSNREMSFMCGIEGSQPQHADALEKLVLDVLAQVAKDGIPQDHVEAILHQLELSQREIGGDSYPYGLQLILSGLSAAIHRGNPIDALNVDPVLEKLREDIKDPEFIKNLVKEQLLDNAHRVRLTMKPDTGLSARRDAAEKQRLEKIKSAMTDDDIEHVIRTAEDLAVRQQEQDDPEVLPKVSLDDVPAKMHIADGQSITDAVLPTSFYAQGTNGLVYQQLVVDLPRLEPELLMALPYYTSVMTEVGCDGKDYVETQAWQAGVSGGISAYTSMRGLIDDVQQVNGHFILSGNALNRHHQDLSNLMVKTLETVRFDEKSRIREIIAQKRARMEQSITGNGHGLAMTAATSGMSPVAKLTHQLSGLAGVKYIKQLDDQLHQDEALDSLIEKMTTIHQQILAAPRQLLLVGEAERQPQLIQDINQYWQAINETNDFQAFSLETIREPVNQMWVANTQVNFCSRAYPTVPVEHEDAAALTVLGGFMRNGFLHTTIREHGGAYGGGAGQESNIAAFRFYSYRDPRLEDTLNDFDRAIDWVLNEQHEWRMVEEAILGVIGSIDKPSSPSGEAKQAFHSQLYGRTPEQRQRFRERVLQVKLDDLKRVTEQYLKPEQASTAVITNAATLESQGDLGLDVHRL